MGVKGVPQRRRFGKNVVAAYVKERILEVRAMSGQSLYPAAKELGRINELERLYNEFKLGEVGR